ncbi:MAG: GNAT family N-acetyltransferase [Desulfobacterales bacterium]
MPPTDNSLFRLAWVKSIAEVDQIDWDALAEPLPTPFLEWEWLRQMELSGSTTAETGWLPQHLTVWSQNQLVAAAPLYIKGHSAGEFVFDHAWADVANRLKIPYYPKLVGMSPFTPMIGYRFLIAQGQDEEGLTALMIGEIEDFCRRHHICSCSFLFVDPDWRQQMTNYGFNSWLHQSFEWQNLGYQSFDDYLTAFNSNQRHNIKRERKSIASQGVTIKIFQGDEIPLTYFSKIYPFYERTNDKFGPWSCKYLNNSFFTGLAGSYRHRCVFVAAFDKTNVESPVGMSLLVRKQDQLFGRYWGCSKEVNHLHFNACYYSPIEWAIARGIKRFDPGMGGYHKIRRGFMAIGNHSLHRFFDQQLDHIMKAHIGEINRLEQEHIDELNGELPFARKA